MWELDYQSQNCFVVKLWNDGDSLMADWGFLISNELRLLNVKLNIPSFLRCRTQLSDTEIKESQRLKKGIKYFFYNQASISQE